MPKPLKNLYSSSRPRKRANGKCPGGKAWSRGEPDANSKVPQKQEEKYLHPGAVIWVVKSSSLKRIQDAVILSSHCTRFLTWGEQKASKTKDSAEGTVPPQPLGTLRMAFAKAATNLACSRRLAV